jgi:hypothetical protein
LNQHRQIFHRRMRLERARKHEHVVDAVQARMDRTPNAMRTRRETVEHPFGTLKMRMGAAHFLMKALPKVATEMALHVSHSPTSSRGSRGP